MSRTAIRPRAPASDLGLELHQPGLRFPVSALYYGQDDTCDHDTGQCTIVKNGEPRGPSYGTLASPEITGLTASSTLSLDYFREVEHSPTGRGGWDWTRAGEPVQLVFVFDTIDDAQSFYTGWLIHNGVVTASVTDSGPATVTVTVVAVQVELASVAAGQRHGLRRGQRSGAVLGRRELPVRRPAVTATGARERVVRAG